MIPTYIGYDVCPIRDALNRLIAIRVMCGTRYFIWAVNDQGELTDLVLFH